jgi:hypothetical protein
LYNDRQRNWVDNFQMNLQRFSKIAPTKILKVGLDLSWDIYCFDSYTVAARSNLGISGIKGTDQQRRSRIADLPDSVVLPLSWIRWVGIASCKTTHRKVTSQEVCKPMRNFLGISGSKLRIGHGAYSLRRELIRRIV